MDLFKAQAERFGTRIVTAMSQRSIFIDRPFRIASSDQEFAETMADAVIVASGASAKWLGIRRSSISPTTACRRAPPATARCSRGATWWWSEAAIPPMEEAIFLTRFATRVNPRAPARGVPRVEDHARARAPQPQDRVHHQRRVEEILGTLPRPGVTGVRLKDTRTGALRTFDTGGVFIAIGHQPTRRCSRASSTWTPTAIC